MNAKIKAVLLSAAAALVMTAGAASAAPNKHHNNGWGKPGPSKFYKKKGTSGAERAAIARSAANLASLKRRVMRDGRVTTLERIQLRNAERRHASLVQRLYRS
jgi:hypothetical protein